MFALPTFWPSLAGSAMLDAGRGACRTVVGLAVAVHLSRMPERPRTMLVFVIALPLTFSGLIVAYGFILGYGRAGFFTQLLALAGVDPAIVGWRAVHAGRARLRVVLLPDPARGDGCCRCW